jgi:anti-sigma regulatory factor (Ser/Thr protein kinase)
MTDQTRAMPVKLSIRSTPTHLPIVRGAVERLCQDLGFGEDCTARIVLSIDEALANVIRHAYDGAPDQPIEIELSVLGPPPGLQVCIRDHGRSVDPSSIKSRDLDDVRPGGLGVHIMTSCMDCLEFRQAEGGGTILTMVKRLSADGKDG